MQMVDENNLRKVWVYPIHFAKPAEIIKLLW